MSQHSNAEVLYLFPEARGIQTKGGRPLDVTAVKIRAEPPERIRSEEITDLF